MPGKFIKGALVHLMEAFLLPIPNIIPFQYNPESIVHSWTPPAGGDGGGGAGGGGKKSCGGGGAGANTGGNPMAASGFPGESFSFTLSMDAKDTIAEDHVPTAQLAIGTGLYTRLAALEMLQYPVTRRNLGLVGSVSVAVGGMTAGAFGKKGVRREVPEMVVPVVFFVWGPGRIVPVRVKSLTITEKQYDFLLNPIQVDAKIDLQVLTPGELNALPKGLKQMAKGAYVYTHGLRQALAVTNLINATESVITLVK